MLRALLMVLVASASASFLGATVSTRATDMIMHTQPMRAPVIEMGRGDKRTKKGKRKAKSFGISRPRNSVLRKAKQATE